MAGEENRKRWREEETHRLNVILYFVHLKESNNRKPVLREKNIFGLKFNRFIECVFDKYSQSR